MSDFVQQHAVKCSFNSSDSWIILTPIELSIKSKIEAIGKPLKEWDIQINYGIKTGYNDAFIISTDKREEILNNCKDEEERTRTADLIRPILRGRDIKRYGYTWADLWLVATFPSRHYNIDDFPAVKSYLLSIGKERLEQTGKTHIIEGEKVKARKKTNNKWFETQDSISYWEDFSKPKIMYPETTQGAYFAYDESGMLLDKTCFIMLAADAKYIQATLSSKLYEYAYKRIYSSIELGEHGFQYNKHALIKLPIAPKNANWNNSDDYFYKLYNLSQDEIDEVENNNAKISR